MKTWYAVVTAATVLTDDQLADAAERLPGYATLVQDAALGRTEARFNFEAATVEGAAAQACACAAAVFDVEACSVTVADSAPETSLRRQLAGALAGATEGAEILGVNRARFHELAKKPPAGWPAPIGRVGASEIYLRADLEAFNASWTRERTGRPADEAVRAANSLHEAAIAALASAGFTQDDIAVNWGADHAVLVMMLAPNFSRALAEDASQALASAGVELRPHAPRQIGHDLVQALADGELLALAPRPMPQDAQQ